MISGRVLKERASLIYKKTNLVDFFSDAFVALAMGASLFTRLMPNMQHIEAFFTLGVLVILLTNFYIRNQFKKLYELIQQLCS